MRKCFVFCIIVIIFWAISSVKAAKQQFSMVRIDLGHDQNLSMSDLLDLGVDIAYFNGKNGFVEAIVDDEQRIAISKLGLTQTPIIDDLAAYAERLRNEGYFEHFHTYAEMKKEMDDIVVAHSDITKLEKIGESYNKVHDRNGYDIWALKISDEVDIDDPSEADALFMANMHAREIITPEIIMYFMHYLIDNYGSDPYVTHLINNREIWLIPTFNPDGHEYVFTGDIENRNNWSSKDPILWRKNMHDNDNNGVFNDDYDGVDLNRNFGHEWGHYDSHTSPNPWDETYAGPSVFSEPESKVIRDFVTAHDFVVSLSYHSYSQLWLYPWGYTYANVAEPDFSSFKALADSCIMYNGYDAQQASDLYIVSGDTDDWLYHEHGIFAFTPEVGSPAQGGFWPDTTLIMVQVLENLGPNLYMAYAAGEEPLVKHERQPDFEITKGSYILTTKIEPPILLTEFVPLDSSSFKVFYNTTDTAQFDSVLLTPTGNLDEYAAEIPGLGLEGKIYYFVSAGDTSGRIGTSPRGAPAALDSFKIKPDMIPPSIVHEPLRYQPPSFSTFEVSADITDNFGIEEVWLHFKQNTEIVSEVPMQLAENDNYSAVIDSLSIAPGDSFQYRIMAVDASQSHNTTYAPEEGWYSFGVFASQVHYDFESDSVCYTYDNSDWEWGIPTIGPDNAHSGRRLWATRLNDNYSNSSDSKLDLPEFVLDKNLKEAALQFWHWYHTELSQGSIWDGGNIKISVDGGVFQVVTLRGDYDGIIDPYNKIVGGQPGFGGPADGVPSWQPEIIDLTEYIGHSVRLRFHFGSDNNTPAPGWYVDDLELLVFPPTVTIAQAEDVNLPQSFELSQNYPNPFNSRTKFEYQLPRTTIVHIAVYNQIGQRVKLLLNARQSAGRHVVDWDGINDLGKTCVSGLYFCRLEAIGAKIARKMLYLK